MSKQIPLIPNQSKSNARVRSQKEIHEAKENEQRVRDSNLIQIKKSVLSMLMKWNIRRLKPIDQIDMDEFNFLVNLVTGSELPLWSFRREILDNLMYFIYEDSTTLYNLEQIGKMFQERFDLITASAK